MLTEASERTCNALRIYAEASINFKELYDIDSVEAIDNLDRAFDGLLMSMHSLYDAMQEVGCPLNWHASGDTAATIIVRNARHHNLNGLFQSWNCLMLKQGRLQSYSGATFLLVNYKLHADEGIVSEYYVPLEDFYKRFDMAASNPKDRLRNPDKLVELLNDECAFGEIVRHAMRHRYPLSQVYVNLIPIVMNAVTRVFRVLLEQGVQPSHYDSNVYFPHFSEAVIANLQEPEFKEIPVICP